MKDAEGFALGRQPLGVYTEQLETNLAGRTEMSEDV